MPDYRFVTYEEFSLPYLTYGNGPDLMLAFHGYQQQASEFEGFEPLLGQQYTIIAFDLFYHGNHAHPLQMALPPMDYYALMRIVEKILWETKNVRFSLMGHSLGGRLAMAIVQKMGHRVKNLFLLAPDGLTRDLHEEFVTGTIAGDMLFRHLIKKPSMFFKGCQLLKNAKLINEKLYKFMVSNMQTEEKRLHVYRTWNIYKKLKPDLSLVANQINARRIKCAIFMGIEDRIIKPKYAKKLSDKLNDRTAVHLLECGHNLLQKKEEISRVILSQVH